MRLPSCFYLVESWHVEIDLLTSRFLTETVNNLNRFRRRMRESAFTEIIEVLSPCYSQPPSPTSPAWWCPPGTCCCRSQGARSPLPSLKEVRKVVNIPLNANETFWLALTQCSVHWLALMTERRPRPCNMQWSSVQASELRQDKNLKLCPIQFSPPLRLDKVLLW